jgi:hypothetical protein
MATMQMVLIAKKKVKRGVNLISKSTNDGGKKKDKGERFQTTSTQNSIRPP